MQARGMEPVAQEQRLDCTRRTMRRRLSARPRAGPGAHAELGRARDPARAGSVDPQEVMQERKKNWRGSLSRSSRGVLDDLIPGIPLRDLAVLARRLAAISVAARGQQAPAS